MSAQLEPTVESLVTHLQVFVDRYRAHEDQHDDLDQWLLAVTENTLRDLRHIQRIRTAERLADRRLVFTDEYLQDAFRGHHAEPDPNEP